MVGMVTLIGTGGLVEKEIATHGAKVAAELAKQAEEPTVKLFGMAITAYLAGVEKAANAAYITGKFIGWYLPW